MSITVSSDAYANFAEVFPSITNSSDWFDFSGGTSVNSSEFQPLCVDMSESALSSAGLTESEIYELQSLIIPNYYGLEIGAAGVTGGTQWANHTIKDMATQYPEQYKQLREKAIEAKKAVDEKYGLHDLTPEERFMMENNPESEEMTEYYYSQFDQEGQDLINLFYPKVAEKYKI